ncbi:hypothetical protein ABL137_001375 [Klebsiella pneumoniae]
MTKSTITREQLIKKAQEQIEFCRHTKITGEGRAHVNQCAALFEIALAAMDSKPHTDDELSNLLWYSQEATCHSDPNYYCEFQRLATPGLIAGIIRELHERRKADSEPVADVVAWSHPNEERKCDIRWRRHDVEPGPLYRHAQPAPVVDADDNFYSWFGREWQENYQHNQYTTAAKQMLGVMAESAWKAGRRAAMLQAGALTNEDTRQVDELTMWIKRLVRSLKNANPDSKLPREAMDYLTAKGLISVGDILR